MISFKQFTQNYKKQFIGLMLTEESNQSLRKWCEERGLDLSKNHQRQEQKPEDFDFHVTVFFSNEPCYIKEQDTKLSPIKVKIDKLDFLGENQNIPTLLVNKEDSILNIRTIYEALGLKDKWDTWKPHVTVSYNYNGEPIKGPLPKTVEVDTIRVRHVK